MRIFVVTIFVRMIKDKPHDIFISYSRHDLQRVIAIRDELKELAGVDSWIDLKGIESGEQFVNSIVKAIDQSKVVLFMVSQASMQSEYTKKEVMYARNTGKKVVPIVLDGKPLSGWFLFEFGVVDYVNIDDPVQKQKFHDNVRSWLGLTDAEDGPLDFFETGMHYYLKQDYDVAFEWFMKAAKYGFAEAQYRIGLCYLNGHGVPIDYTQAMEWYQKAAAQNHAAAQNAIGLLYKHGMGVESDNEKALQWYRKAANNGSLEAQYNIGKCYYYGRGIAINYSEAVKHFLATAEKGYDKSLSTLGYCYLMGEGVPTDYRKAIYWLDKGAHAGTPAAQFHLGRCYYHGLGVDVDYDKAIHWFRQSVKHNHGAAEYYLGLCYMNGYGVEKDEAAAQVCFRKAVKQGYEDAARYLPQKD